VNCFTRQTVPTINREQLFMYILCIESFCPQKKRTRECCFSVVQSSSMIAILNTKTGLWTCTCMSAS
jgi:hypothetical protein